MIIRTRSRSTVLEPTCSTGSAIARGFVPTAFATLTVALSALIPAVAADDGRYAIVQNQQRSVKPGAQASVPAVAGSGISLDEQETTGPASAAKMTFGEGAVVSLGQGTTFTVTREAVDEATGAKTSTMDLLAGKARVFVSRFWSGRPEVRVSTPTAVAGVKGSEVGVEVFPDKSTLVTVISGSAWVEAKGEAGTRRELSARRRVRIDATGRFETENEAPVAALEDLRKATEPVPLAPRELIGKKPTQDAPPGSTSGSAASFGKRGKSRMAQATSAVSAMGALWSDPAANVPPDPIVTPTKACNPQTGACG